MGSTLKSWHPEKASNPSSSVMLRIKRRLKIQRSCPLMSGSRKTPSGTRAYSWTDVVGPCAPRMPFSRVRIRNLRFGSRSFGSRFVETPWMRPPVVHLWREPRCRSVSSARSPGFCIRSVPRRSSSRVSVWIRDQGPVRPAFGLYVAGEMSRRADFKRSPGSLPSLFVCGIILDHPLAHRGRTADWRFSLPDRCFS